MTRMVPIISQAAAMQQRRDSTRHTHKPLYYKDPGVPYFELESA